MQIDEHAAFGCGKQSLVTLPAENADARSILVAAVSLGGCATIVRGSEEQIAFQSEPPGATVRLSNGLSCEATPCDLKVARKDDFTASFTKEGFKPQSVWEATPCDLKVARKDDFTASFTKEGFKPQSVRVVSHVSGTGAAVGAGNIIAGGVIGVGVDAYNGANLDHEPNPVLVTLQPLQAEKRIEEKKSPRKRREPPVS